MSSALISDLAQFCKFGQNFEWRLKERLFRIILSIGEQLSSARSGRLAPTVCLLSLSSGWYELRKLRIINWLVMWKLTSEGL